MEENVHNLEEEKKAIIAIRSKIKKFYKISEKALFERDELVRLITLAIFSKDHLFLYGPPGSAKSVAAQALRLLMKDRKFFRYLMTDYTKYEEIFGKEVRANDGEVSKRIIDGKLPTAEYGFLDEIFKGNAEILNSLLTILNERQFDDDYNGTIDVPIYTVIAASNEFPRTTYLKALFERFPLRIPVPNIKEKDNRIKLLNGDIKVLKDVPSFTKDEVDFVLKNYSKVKFTYENGELLNSIIDTLHELMNPDSKEGGVERIYEISGRTTVKIGTILRISAYLNKRQETDVSDLMLLRYIVWNNLFERDRVIPKINQLLFGAESEVHGDTIRELDIMSVPTMRYLKNMRGYTTNNLIVQTEKEYLEIIYMLRSFLDEYKNINKTLLGIVEKLDECRSKELLIEKNIFLHVESILEWRVDKSLILVNSEKFHELRKLVANFEKDAVIENEKTKFRLVDLIGTMLKLHTFINDEIVDWLSSHDSYLHYKTNFNIQKKEN